MRKTKVWALSLALGLLVMGMGSVSLAAPGDLGEAVGVDNANNAPTKEEVNTRWRGYESKSPAKFLYQGVMMGSVLDPSSYVVLPSRDGKEPGVLRKEMKDDIRFQYNTFRYSLNLEENVENEENTKKAQAGAYLSTLNQKIQHTDVKRPNGVSDALYELGKDGTKHSCLHFRRLDDSINGMIRDEYGEDNLIDTGHRAWFASYRMKHIGIGYAGEVMDVYMGNGYGGKAETKVIAAPSRYAAFEWYGNRAPLSLYFDESGEDKFDVTNASVTIKRASDGKTWSLTKGNGLNVIRSCVYDKGITFGRDVLSYGFDTYQITVSGVTKNGKAYPISYSVETGTLDPGFEAILKEDPTQVPWYDTERGVKEKKDKDPRAVGKAKNENMIDVAVKKAVGEKGKSENSSTLPVPGELSDNSSSTGLVTIDQIPVPIEEIEEKPVEKKIEKKKNTSTKIETSKKKETPKKKDPIAPKTGDVAVASYAMLFLVSFGMTLFIKLRIKPNYKE